MMPAPCTATGAIEVTSMCEPARRRAGEGGGRCDKPTVESWRGGMLVAAEPVSPNSANMASAGAPDIDFLRTEPTCREEGASVIT